MSTKKKKKKSVEKELRLTCGLNRPEPRKAIQRGSVDLDPSRNRTRAENIRRQGRQHWKHDYLLRPLTVDKETVKTAGGALALLSGDGT